MKAHRSRGAFDPEGKPDWRIVLRPRKRERRYFVSMAPLIASRTVVAVDRSGKEFTVTLGVGMPYEISTDEWACPVCLEGLHTELRDQHGADSWQALQLAYQLAGRLLQYFVQDGGQLLWPTTREVIPLAELFPYGPTQDGEGKTDA